MSQLKVPKPEEIFCGRGGGGEGYWYWYCSEFQSWFITDLVSRVECRTSCRSSLNLGWRWYWTGGKGIPSTIDIPGKRLRRGEAPASSVGLHSHRCGKIPYAAYRILLMRTWSSTISGFSFMGILVLQIVFIVGDPTMTSRLFCFLRHPPRGRWRQCGSLCCPCGRLGVRIPIQ